jgi:hypothetical protein
MNVTCHGGFKTCNTRKTTMMSVALVVVVSKCTTQKKLG